MPLEQTQRDAEDRTTISAWRSQASHRTNQPAQEPEAEAPRRVIKGPHATILGPVGALAKQTEWGGRTERAPHTHLSPSACRYLSGTAVLPLCKKKKPTIFTARMHRASSVCKSSELSRAYVKQLSQHLGSALQSHSISIAQSQGKPKTLSMAETLPHSREHKE